MHFTIYPSFALIRELQMWPLYGKWQRKCPFLLSHVSLISQKMPFLPSYCASIIHQIHDTPHPSSSYCRSLKCLSTVVVICAYLRYPFTQHIRLPSNSNFLKPLFHSSPKCHASSNHWTCNATMKIIKSCRKTQDGRIFSDGIEVSD